MSVDRNLDGCYFRVKRNGKWSSVCFSDLTVEERYALFESPECAVRSVAWWKSLAYHMGDRLKLIGDTFDIVSGDGEK